MFKFIKRIIHFRKFVKYADSVGFNLNNHTPVEALAFQTVAAMLLNPNKDYLNKNNLTIYDTIIFTLFMIRMLCISKIENRAKAEEFSDDYIAKVFQYFPQHKQISKEYDSEFFEERVKYYDYIFMNETSSFDERIEMIIKAFGAIITYDYNEEYVRFNKHTPLMITDVFEQIQILMSVKAFYKTFPDFFGKILPDIYKFYN